MYCPRRFALLSINKDWAENVFVVKANIMHENVHSGRHEKKTAKKTELSAVTLFSDKHDLLGVADCIEFIKRKDGVYIPGLEDYYKINLIEYKPTQPRDGKIRETDAIQVFAQKLCADEMWGCNSEGYIYYADTRKRVKLPFDEAYESYYSELSDLLEQMKGCLDSGSIPDRKRGQKCSGCSIKDLCMPKEKKYNVKNEILKEIT